MKAQFVILLATTLLMGCAKDVDEPLQDQGQGLSKTSYYRVIKRDGYGNLACSGQGGNCLPDVVIRGISQNLLGDFITATYDSDLQLFFSPPNNGDSLFKDFDQFPPYLGGLQDGSLTFTLLPSDNVNTILAALHPATASGAVASGDFDDIIFVFPMLK